MPRARVDGEPRRSCLLPLAAAEGFIRQVLGWREFVNGVYWLRMPGYAELNELDAHGPVPPALLGDARTDLACVQHVADVVERLAWTHHIDRLMIAGNLMLLLGTDPIAANTWFRERFADGYDWVMQANVTGMALHADGGFMATKPYAAGGAYLKRMTGHCKGCRFDPARRTGDDACPFTTLYWDFTARHLDRLASNPRTAQAARGWGRFDADEQGKRIAAATKSYDAAPASHLAETNLGDAIYANMIMLGFAWQKGVIPISSRALYRAIKLKVGRGIDVDLSHVAAVRAAIGSGRFGSIGDGSQNRRAHGHRLVPGPVRDLG